MASTQTNPLPSIPTTAPMQLASFEEQWNFIKTGIDYQLDSGFNLPPADHANVYSTVWNCLTCGNRIRDSPENAGTRLYAELTSYFARYLTSLKHEKFSNLQGTDLLQTYASEWSRFTTNSRKVNGLLGYLNRYWVQAQRMEIEQKSGTGIVYTVDAMALAQWREHILLAIQEDNEKLTTAIINLVIQHPTAESTEGVLVKQVLDSFATLGFTPEDPKEENPRIYKEHFEEPFLKTLGLKGGSSTTTSAPDKNEVISNYLAWVKARFEEHKSLGQGYLHSSTEDIFKSAMGLGEVTENNA
ncbi:Cullin repeat-containing protein [Pluteus cervinus]|uniref:Cullin repeat-containing protein n=1 Tax=Pluteus cervinus TaxID=181527 RepID=A0ACD2ZXB8_9AGAR|nr:Cullin repeat-containing protein [Pluteus cervinus]